jgi:uncharacterized membrane protein
MRFITEKVPSNQQPIPVLVLLAIKYFFALDKKGCRQSPQDWGYLKASLVTSLIFNIITSASMAYALGTLAELSTGSTLVIGLAVFSVLWCADYSIAHLLLRKMPGKMDAV